MAETTKPSTEGLQTVGRLIGTWRLLSALSTTTSGERDEAPYKAGAAGFLTYTQDGRMVALITYGGRRPLSLKPQTEEQAEAFKTFFAYAGSYELKEDKIIHHIEVSSIQNYVNRDLVRTVKLENDQMILTTPPTSVNGKTQTVELTWQRVSPPHETHAD